MQAYGRQADILRIIAHPVRIRILNELVKGVKCVSDMEKFLELPQSNVSQHLSVLRNSGMIDYYTDGRLRCYFLREPMIPDLLEVLGREYSEALPAPECCPVTKKGTYPGGRQR
jgi:DNA-binding transcriptional ArsR family regulator